MVRDSPFMISTELSLRDTDWTLTSGLETVTEHVADFPSAVAVIVACPAATAVTRPLETVATEVLDEDQLTVLFVALEGETVAVSVLVSSFTIERVVLLSVTDVTLTVVGVDGVVELLLPSHDDAIKHRAAPKIRAILFIFVFFLNSLIKPLGLLLLRSQMGKIKFCLQL